MGPASRGLPGEEEETDTVEKSATERYLEILRSRTAV
jgi:hypothetical protein